MKTSTLIVSYDPDFARAIASELALVERAPVVAVAEPADPGADGISWRPSSYASTRSVIVEAGCAEGGFSEAVLVAPYPAAADEDDSVPVAERVQAYEPPGTLAGAVDARAVGFMTMARELATKLSGGGGRLLLVHPPAESFAAANAPLSEQAASGAVDAFAAGMARLSTAIESGQPICDAFEIVDTCPQRELTAQFVARALAKPFDRKASRVLRWNGKTGIFGLF